MPLPVISIAQMREWEQATWDAGESQDAVIQRAGAAVAEVTMGLSRPGDDILVLAGRGHNGDDARAAAAVLQKRQVTQIDVVEPAKAIKPVQNWLAGQNPDLAWIVDGLFGIGLNRPLEGAWLDIIRCLNESSVPAIAVDVPTGLNADTGEPFGEAVRAAVTVTFGAPKSGFLNTAASSYVGRLEVAPDIGLVPCPFQSELGWVTREDFAAFPPRRPVTGHKGSFGHLCIIAGSKGYHGAAVLAALGAQRAQPGLITLVVPDDIYVPVASQLRSTMVKSWEDNFRCDDFSAVVFGPGLAHPALPSSLKKEVVRTWQEHPAPVLADASALDWLPPGSFTSKAPRVITPHPGEAARMLKSSPAAIQEDRLAALRQLSSTWNNCWVVLKGHQTISGQALGPVLVNSSGNPHLAQGGAGDVLSGWLGGLLAQPELQNDPARAIAYAVWRHGRAADSLSRRTKLWTPDDLIRQLGR